MGIFDGFDRMRGTEELPPPDPPDTTWPRWVIALVIAVLALAVIVGVAHA